MGSLKKTLTEKGGKKKMVAKEKSCKYESQITLLIDHTARLVKVLDGGDGKDGLIKEIDQFKDSVWKEISKNRRLIEKLQSYAHLRSWILGGVITVMSFIIGALLRLGTQFK